MENQCWKFDFKADSHLFTFRMAQFKLKPLRLLLEPESHRKQIKLANQNATKSYWSEHQSSQSQQVKTAQSCQDAESTSSRVIQNSFFIGFKHSLIFIHQSQRRHDIKYFSSTWLLPKWHPYSPRRWRD